MAISRSNIYVAISGGHTRSSAVAFSAFDGPIVAVEGPRFNLHVDDPRTARANLADLLDNLDELYPEPLDRLRSVRRVAVVCAGAAFSKDQNRIREFIRRRYADPSDPNDIDRFEIADDTWAGLLAGTHCYSGVCALAGTGASVFVGTGEMPSGWSRKIDGWGSIIGDYGSAFQLAVNAFRGMGRYEDAHRAPPAIFDGISALVDRLINRREPDFYAGPLDSFDEAQEWFDALVSADPRGWRISFAKLAQAITEMAQTAPPDAMAKKLLLHSAFEMTQSIKIGLKRWPCDFSPPIILHGAMFEHSQLFFDRVCNGLKSESYSKIELPLHKPIFGACLIALCGLGRTPTPEQVISLGEQVQSLPASQIAIVRRKSARTIKPV